MAETPPASNPSPAARPQAPQPGAAVAVLGEALVDVFDGGREVPGGAPFNVARWLAAFGVPTLFVSRIAADDAAGRLLRGEMRRVGLSEQGLQRDAARATGLVQVRREDTGHRFEIAPDSAWDHIEAAPARPLLQALAPGVVVFGTLALRGAASREAITEMVTSTPALRFADLNLRAVDGLQGLAAQALTLADWVKVNEEELQTLLGWFVSPSAPPPVDGSAAHAGAVAALLQRFGVRRLIVTEGAAGWFAVDANGIVDLRGPAVAVDRIEDTVGAGDAFAAATLAGCLHGQPLAQALAGAARLASAVCTWPGALPANPTVIAHWRLALGLGPSLGPGLGIAPGLPASTAPRAPGATA